MFLFDLELLRRVQALDRKDVSSADETRKAEALSRLSEFAEIKRQWKDIGSCKHRFNKLYLKDSQFIYFWEKGLQVIRRVLGCTEVSGNQIEKRRTFESILLGYDNRASALYTELIHIAGEDILEEDVLYLIRERWMRLDDVLNWYYNVYLFPEEGAPYMSRSAPTWSVYKSQA